jgi:hypothetical protein
VRFFHEEGRHAFDAFTLRPREAAVNIPPSSTKEPIMALQRTSEHKVRKTGGDNAPPQPPIDPPVGSVSTAPIPEGIERQAQTLIHQAGSPALAKNAVDGAAQRETIPDFREDLFGQRFGFASRPELLAASTPLSAADGTSWWTTAIDGNRWIVWNQKDMSASKTYATLQDARSSLHPTIA